MKKFDEFIKESDSEMKINYFSNLANPDSKDYNKDWNAKLLYKYNGKLQHCVVYVDFYNKEVYIPSEKKQPKECKIFPKSLAKDYQAYVAKYFSM